MMRPKYWFLVFVTGALSFAQESPTAAPPEPGDQQPAPSQGGWRRADEPRAQDNYPAVKPLPGQLAIPAGTWITVRVNDSLSSDLNRTGDSFTATLEQPVVSDGYVMARRGQLVGGRVVEAVKAGMAKGVSRLAIELTEVGLADGRQMPITTQLISYSAGTSVGRDVTAVGTTAGVGAAIGAIAAGGPGAGLGAAAGAGAAGLGVLLTRGRATVVYPEAVLTFRLQAPLMVNTDNGGGAFQPVRAGDYQQASPQLQRRAAPTRPAPSIWYPYPYYSPYYWGSGWGYGPSIFVSSRPYFGRGGRWR